MGKLYEVSKGIYILDATVGEVHIKKAFKEIKLDEISENPKLDGFYLHIEDK